MVYSDDNPTPCVEINDFLDTKLNLADYYKIQQSIWKCIWMRFGNRVIKSKMRKATTVAGDDYDTVD